MGLATGIIVGSLIAGGGLGLRGCSETPRYKVGDCVRSVDSFGEFRDDYIHKITKINNKDYKYSVWTERHGFFMEQTSSIDIMNDEKYYKQTSCPE